MRTDLSRHSLSPSFDRRLGAYRSQFRSLELEFWVLFVICFLVLVISLFGDLAGSKSGDPAGTLSNTQQLNFSRPSRHGRT